ncbi:MAG TPA: molybdopterin-dependent oxidoreductase [Acetobacteraceae bacterium]|nr:molybdopterin-dependent oxidoreductase [Acetobacteraceae bacterium]
MSPLMLDRRRLLLRATSLAAVGLLPGCDYNDPKHPDISDRILQFMSRFNDRVQAALFDPHKLAPTFSENLITNPPRFNAFYDIAQAPEVDPLTFRLKVSGLVTDQSAWSLDRLRSMTQESQITRMTCVEGWRVIGQWSGVPLRQFLAKIGADLTARYVTFRCADGYYSSIDMPSALQAQTILALDFLGKPLTAPFGAPVRLRIPVKLGFKNPKSVTAIEVGNTYTGGYWEDQGYNWFSGS